MECIKLSLLGHRADGGSGRVELGRQRTSSSPESARAGLYIITAGTVGRSNDGETWRPQRAADEGPQEDPGASSPCHLQSLPDAQLALPVCGDALEL